METLPFIALIIWLLLTSTVFAGDPPWKNTTAWGANEELVDFAEVTKAAKWLYTLAGGNNMLVLLGGAVVVMLIFGIITYIWQRFAGAKG